MKNSKTTYLVCRNWRDQFQRLFLIAFFSVLAIGASAQSKTVSGTVIDATGESVIGANVLVKGTTNGVITDIDGKFILQNVPANGTIQISFMGYKTQDISVAGKTTLNVKLQEDSELLDEVVVVGYGTVKKSDVTGAVTKVSEKQIKERPVQNALQAMQGKAPGVDITTNSRPGELGDVRIRGNRSITADNDPLYVIDGIPMVAGSVSDVNPNDIESMEILKDASATAIYGSRGANGVILITTKSGKTGKVNINYDGTVTISKIHSMTDWMDSGELIDWNRQTYINAGAYTGAYGTAPDPDIDGDLLFGGISKYPYLKDYFSKAWEYNADGSYKMRPATAAEKEAGLTEVPIYNSRNIPTTPWTDYVSRTAITQNHQVSLSAGTETSKLYFSFAYLDQESPMKDQDFTRYTAKISGEIQASSFLKVGMGVNLNHSIKNYGIINNGDSGYKDSYGYALDKLPYAPAYDTEGKPLNVTEGPSFHNPMLDVTEAINETRYYGVMLNSFAEVNLGKIYQPLEGLTWRTNFGTQFRNTRYGSYYGNDFSNPKGHAAYDPNTAFNQQGQKLSWTLENLIFYNKTFHNIHSVGLTLMQSAEYSRAEGLEVRAYNVTFPTALWYSVGNSDLTRDSPASSFVCQNRASYMARLNYSLMNRYLLTVTGRWDGASMLAAGNKWDFFPSAALAWKMNEEDFMKDISWLDQIKLRVGYGVTGNASISPYQTTGSMTTSGSGKFIGIGNITNETIGAKASVLPNKALGWEKTATTNFGVDFGFLNNRISGSIEYYVANTSNLLLNKAIPYMTGYTTILTNVGKTRNKGLEITLSTVNIKTRDFTWKTDFTFSTNKEEIMELANGKVDDTANKWFIGRPINDIWVYKYDRLWQNTNDDLRQLALYKELSKTAMLPGMAKVVDQPFIEVAPGTDGAKTKEIIYTKVGDDKPTTETVTYLDNGYGTINNDDKKHIGSFSPKWIGGFTTTFIYKNWQLNSFIYARMGNTYYGLMQTYGRREEKDVWSNDNPGGRFPMQRSGGVPTTDYSSYMGFTKGNMIAIRNIALSYSLPEKWLKKAGIANCQVYGQVLNPFIFGGDLVKAGINPDDTTGWSATANNNDTGFIGGQSNNTVLTRSYVIGLRLGF